MRTDNRRVGHTKHSIYKHTCKTMAKKMLCIGTSPEEICLAPQRPSLKCTSNSGRSIPKSKRGSLGCFGSCSSSSRVSFGSVQVRSFPNELGHQNIPKDGGPPVTISWQFEKEAIYDIDLYESKRLRRQNLHLSDHKRTVILQDAGYSLQDIRRAEDRADATRRQRDSTIKTMFNENAVDELLISAGVAGHKVVRVFGVLKKAFGSSRRPPRASHISSWPQPHFCPAA
jgi:hypothetical protein